MKRATMVPLGHLSLWRALGRSELLFCLTAWIFVFGFSQVVTGQSMVRQTSEAAALQDRKGLKKDVTFQTEDGWTIYGTLRLPPEAGPGSQVPGLILLHEEKHDRTDFEQVLDRPGMADVLTQAGFAALNIDWRGRGQSMGKGQPIEDELHMFSAKARQLMYLDVTAAIDFLASQAGVDRQRIGIVAAEFSAQPAVRAVEESPVLIRSLVLMSGTNLTQESKDYLAGSDIPIFVSASPDDKLVFGDMAEVYSRSKNKASYIMAPHAGPRAYRLFLMELIREPSKERYLLDVLVDWLTAQVKSIGRVRAVSFETEDGWTIHGNFRYPDDLGRSGEKVPAVVIAPGARSDRFGLYPFEVDMAKRGIAVLSIEMRGRGQSRSGSGFESPEMRKVWRETLQSAIHLDTKAAIEFLTSQEGIDVNSIAAMGVSIGTKSAILGTAGDPRVKTLVLISAYGSDDPEVRQVVSQTNMPMLLIDVEKSPPTRARTESLYEVTNNARLVLYPVIGQGEHVPELAPEVIELVGNWMQEKLLDGEDLAQ